jgi:glucose/arabinose dehydrogenase
MAGAGALALVGCGRDGEGRPGREPSASRPVPSGPVKPRVAGTIASGLDVPWGLVFISGGRALVSQRNKASIVLIDPDAKGDSRVRELGTVPGVWRESDSSAGLLGLALDPDDSSQLFACHTSAGDLRVVRIELHDDSLGEIEPVLTGVPIGGGHYGGRLAFGQDGHMYVATGDSQVGARAQDRTSLAGKILRITKDGKPVDGNPFDNEVWSLGHRNVEGIAFDNAGRLWSSEFGESRVDELNLITKGGNYGWPEFEGTSDDPRFVSPKATWGVAVCSPAGITVARSTAFVAALRGQRLWSVPLDGTTTGKPRDHFVGEYGRLRTVEAAPDGSLWLTTSNTDGYGTPPGPGDDRILRVVLD